MKDRILDIVSVIIGVILGLAIYFTMLRDEAQIPETSNTDSGAIIKEEILTEESTEEYISENRVIYPDMPSETVEGAIVLRDILDTGYAVWLPGNLPQTQWGCDGDIERTFVLDQNTAMIDGNVILDFGTPDRTGTVYAIGNYATEEAIRSVCSDAELKGANRLVVCNIKTPATWLNSFVESRVES